MPADIEAGNANYVGGDIAGGVADLRQLFTRPGGVVAAVGDRGARALPVLGVDAAGRRRPRHVRPPRRPPRPATRAALTGVETDGSADRPEHPSVG